MPSTTKSSLICVSRWKMLLSYSPAAPSESLRSVAPAPVGSSAAAPAIPIIIALRIDTSHPLARITSLRDDDRVPVLEHDVRPRSVPLDVCVVVEAVLRLRPVPVAADDPDVALLREGAEAAARRDGLEHAQVARERHARLGLHAAEHRHEAAVHRQDD